MDEESVVFEDLEVLVVTEVDVEVDEDVAEL